MGKGVIPNMDIIVAAIDAAVAIAAITGHIHQVNGLIKGIPDLLLLGEHFPPFVPLGPHLQTAMS
jgi:hypothetical protein